jgi:hypothetical protein
VRNVSPTMRFPHTSGTPGFEDGLFFVFCFFACLYNESTGRGIWAEVSAALREGGRVTHCN